jgi:hypothetical protein
MAEDPARYLDTGAQWLEAPYQSVTKVTLSSYATAFLAFFGAVE